MDKVTHGYWGIRGLGQTSRLLLAYSGAVWEDVKYTSPEQWHGKDKQELGLAFPNLPYLIDGDLKITESSAVQRHIIRKYGKTDLLGKTLEDQAWVDCLIGVFGDIRSPFGGLFFDKEWESKIPAVIEKVSPKFQQMAKFYGEKNFALGYLTLVDFYLAEFSYFVQKLAPQIYEKHGFLQRLREAFEGLPEIKKYYEQESAVKGPFLPPSMPIQI